MPVPIPQFTALPPTQVFNSAGNPVTFTNLTNAGTWNWLWKFGDGTTSTQQHPIHNYTTLGDFSVSLTVSNANCSDSTKRTVSVTPEKPVARFDSIPSGCQPLAVKINNTFTSYRNTRDNIFSGTLVTDILRPRRNPTYTYFDAGMYVVKLRVTGPGGFSEYTQVVSSNPSPKAYFEASPEFVYVNDAKVRCFNRSELADYYLWEFGDGDTSKVYEPYHKIYGSRCV